MAKDKDLEPIVTKIVDQLKKQNEKIIELNDKIGKFSEAYMEGVKDGIAWSEKHRG